MINPPGLQCLGDPRKLPDNGVVVDVRRYPLVIVRIRGRLSDDQLEQYLHYMEQLPSVDHDPSYHGVLLYDMHDAVPFPAKQRRRQAQWIMEQREGRMGKSRTDVAFVTSSGILRGALRAVFWLISREVKYTVWADYAEAYEWATSRLHASG